ncbi:MAG: hypothetical protein H7X99_10140, partial [Saprospiraceae bacterium]|nr:hypothetical protein [Saprospiraceae bacterium]
GGINVMFTANPTSGTAPLDVAFTDHSIGNYNASKFIIDDEHEGFKVILDPDTQGVRTLDSVANITIDGDIDFKVTYNPISGLQVYTNKVYLSAENASSGIDVNLNPGSIYFNTTTFIVEEE